MPTSDATGAFDTLDAVIAEYLQAAEAGQAAPRQGLLDRHPELADRLRAFFTDFDAVGRDVSRFRLPDPNSTVAEGPTATNLPTVRYLGDYELVNEIARGGMGVVYRARQVSLNRPVAVKMILAGAYATEEAVQRFRAEAEAAAHLDHPNILPIYEVGEHEEHQYFSMKLVEGGSLASRVAELVARPREAVTLVAAVVRAVDFAHKHGVLHRDLKPANILLDADGTPYVSDFGLAKRTHGDSGLTHTGAFVGTPSYMAPEQARAEKLLTTAADVYSLGAILYELLTGQPPFRAGSVYETIQRVIEKEPADPRQLNPGVDRDLAAIALKCLAKDPAGRFGSAAEMADDLDRWQNGEPTQARPLSLAGQAWRWLRRHTAAAATLLVLGVLWGGLSGVALVTAQPADSVPMAMLSDGTGPLNPLGWAWSVRQSPGAWYATLGATLVLTVILGWLLRLGTNPKTSRAALGFATVTGLLATLIGFMFVSPLLAVVNPAEVHHIQEAKPEISKKRDGTLEASHPDQDYLLRFVPPEHRAEVLNPSSKKPAIPGQTLAPLSNYQEWNFYQMIAHAQQANRIYAASIGIWLGQWFTLCYFLGLSLASMWAVDFPARTGRRLLARLYCYLELYLLTAALILASLLVSGLWIAVTIDPQGSPSMARFVGPWAALAGLVGAAYVGVIRRWHPLVRLLVYAAWVVLMVLAFGFALQWAV